MDDSVTWPLAFNIIRRQSTHNTYGMVRTRSDGTPRPHQGWDFTAPLSTPAFAIAAGTVDDIVDRGDYGLQLTISFSFKDETLYAFYAHLSKVLVEEGASVQKNQLVCYTGESGNAKGMVVADQHLHFEIRTKLKPRLGLHDRVSPFHVFEKCPLNQGIAG
jgi:murein DD-endopeptidase MepM/ murein hydrolase activator NlpD